MRFPPVLQVTFRKNAVARIQSMDLLTRAFLELRTLCIHGNGYKNYQGASLKSVAF